MAVKIGSGMAGGKAPMDPVRGRDDQKLRGYRKQEIMQSGP